MLGALLGFPVMVALGYASERDVPVFIADTVVSGKSYCGNGPVGKCVFQNGDLFYQVIGKVERCKSFKPYQRRNIENFVLGKGKGSELFKFSDIGNVIYFVVVNRKSFKLCQRRKRRKIFDKVVVKRKACQLCAVLERFDAGNG